MNYIITVINPEAQDLLTTICHELGISLVIVLYGEGTADKSIRSLLGMDYPREKRIVMTAASDKKTEKLKQAEKRYLDIDAPGNGVTAVIPVRAVGGKKTLAYLLNNEKESFRKPDLNTEYELLLCICNRGTTNMVVSAAKKAGARGGTVLHAKRSDTGDAPQFYNVTLNTEKEVVMIIVPSSKRNEIMTGILKEAGPASSAGSIVISLPVTSAAGIDTVKQQEIESALHH